MRKVAFSDHGQRDDEDVVCYDTETSSAEVRHCQVLQFAAIRADASLSELEAHDFRIRRLPYVVPSPEALQVTGIDVRRLDDPSLPTEFEAMARVESILRAPQGRSRVFLTFNGIRFDDEVLRVALARNLRDSFFSSGRDAIRVDVMALVQLAVAGGAGISGATGEDGRPSWRLEAVCRANGIGVDAHDALGDARSTLDLARLVREKAGWAWEAARRGGNAGRVDKRLAADAGSDAVVWHFNHFGEPDLAPCIVVGQDSRRRFLLQDLRVQVEAGVLATVDVSDHEARRAAGLRIVKAGNAPLLLSDDDAARFAGAMSPEDARVLARRVFGRREDYLPVIEAFRTESFAKGEALTPEQRIYDGFASPADKARMGSFHRAASWDERAVIAFDDDRLAEYAARILAMTAPPSDDLFAPPGGEAGERFRAACAATMARPYADASSPWETLASCYPEADEAWREWARETFEVDPALVAACADTTSPVA